VRHTEAASQAFQNSARWSGFATSPLPLKSTESPPVETVDGRIWYLASAMALMAEGLDNLTDAIRDVYDKLDAMDRKSS
jgi:hypothetical protein